MNDEKRLKRGNKVTVYRQPKLMSDLEGTGTLITHQEDGGNAYLDERGYEVWSLKFENRPGLTFNRIVHLRDLHSNGEHVITQPEVQHSTST